MRTILLLLALCLPVAADVVHLKNGGKIEGNVTDAGESYKVDTGYGSVTLPKTDVDRIEKKEFKAPDKPVFKKSPPRLRDSYAQPFYGFKIYLPNGWGVAPPTEKQKVKFFGPKDQLYTPHMDLRVDVTRITVADLVNRFKSTFINQWKDVLFVYEEATVLRDKEAYQFIVDFTDDGIKQRAIWTIVAGDGLIYTIGFGCTAAWFDKYHAQIDASMRSLRLFPLPSAPLEQRKEFDKAYHQAGALLKEGKRAEALKLYEKAATLIPEFADIHNIVGTQHVKIGNWAAAEKAYKRALEIDPYDYEYAFNLGLVLTRQEKFKEAIEALEKAVKADPAMEPALTNLGATYVADGQPAKAVEVLKRAVLADPESAPAHFNLGAAYERAKQPAEAEAEYRETLKIDAKHQGAKDGLDRLKKKK